MPAAIGHPILRLTPVSAVYTVKGANVKSVLESLGKSQADLTRACGFASETRVCRIVKSEAFSLSSDAARKLVAGLRQLGAVVEGLVPGIDAEAPVAAPAGGVA